MNNDEILWVIEYISSDNVEGFYKTTRWKKLRKEVLEDNNYDCQHCKSKGDASKANTVHHVKHLKKHPELALSKSNLMAVCKSCHNELHPEKHYSFMIFKNNNKKKQLNEEKW